MKPNVRLKGSSKSATLTSQRVLDQLTKARNQRQKKFERDRRSRSLDRMSTQGGSGSNSPGNSPEGGNNNGSGGSSGYGTRSKTKTNSPFVTSNQFDPLGDDDPGNGIQVEQQKKAPRVRIPPIYIMGKSEAEVVYLLSSNGIPQGDDYVLKFTKTSVQFLTKSKELFEKTTSLLKNSDVQFFTHDTSENVPSKFVLSGLPAVNIPDLQEELEALNIVPLDIKVLSSKKSGGRLSNANKILLYKLIFRPTIAYGFPAWHSCATTRRKRLQTRQNKLLKMMLDMPFNFPTDELVEAANTETLDTWTSRLLHRFWSSCAISDSDLISNLVP